MKGYLATAGRLLYVIKTEKILAIEPASVKISETEHHQSLMAKSTAIKSIIVLIINDRKGSVIIPTH